MSVILPVYNGERNVVKMVSELSAQAYSNFEIVLVDDGSTDGTYDEATRAAFENPRIRVVRTVHGGASRARNTGTMNARGEIIFFAEVDCTYERDYIQKAVDCLEKNENASAVCLTGAPLKLKSTMATECIDIENKIQHKLLETGEIRPFYAWVYRKEALESVGGFDEALFQGEDKDLFRRIETSGRTIALVPGVHWRHERDQTLAELASKWYRRGQTRILFLMKHRLIRDILRGIVPLFAYIIAVLLFFLVPIAGVLLVLAITASFAYRTIRTAQIGWKMVEKKRFLVYYFVFILVRNLTSGLGYTMGMLKRALGIRIEL